MEMLDNDVDKKIDEDAVIEINTEINTETNNDTNTDTNTDTAPEDKKKNKKLGAGTIVLIVFLVLIKNTLVSLAVVAVFAVPYVRRYIEFPSREVLDSYDTVDISLTDEQKLEDLQAMYETAFLGNPTCEERAELYGIDYEAIYKEYQEKIVATQNEFEYYCVMYDFISYVGSGHNYLMYPHYIEVTYSGFELNMEALEGDDTIEYFYNWEQYIKNTYRDYWAECASIRYVDGTYYVFGVMDKSIWPKEYWGAEVLSINGGSTVDFVIENQFHCQLEYDDVNGVVYRSAAYFNNTKGTPTTLELCLVDGSIVKYETYVDPYAEIAMLMEYYDEAYVNNTDTDIVTDNYELVESVEDDYVYLKINSCMTGEDDAKMVEELEDALTRHDTVIIDLRGNGGGYISYFNNYVTPYVFDETIDIYIECNVQKNALTDKWVSDPSTRLFRLVSPFTRNGEYIFYDNLYYYGGADKHNKVYILVDEGTYSSSDRFVYAASTLDNVTIIGSHTGGEGIEGPIFMYHLPNSRLCYAFTPCYNAETEGSDMLVGLTPDVVLTTSLEDKREFMNYYYAGENPYSYEIMMQYDDVLLDAIEYVKNDRQ